MGLHHRLLATREAALVQAQVPQLLPQPGVLGPGVAAAVRHSGASAVACSGRARSAARQVHAHTLMHITHSVLDELVAAGWRRKVRRLLGFLWDGVRQT